MDQSLIDKFKQGRCTPEEVKAVLDWYNSEECERRYSEQIDKAIKIYDESIVLQDSNKESVYSKLRSRIQRDVNIKERTGRSFFHRFANIAAVILFLAAAIVVVFEYSRRAQSENGELPAVQSITKSTTLGQKSTIFLSDGSIITLNSGSSVQYPAGFGDENRKVTLTGEAFFQIAKDPGRPFIVHASDLSITALGTSFNIRSYENEDHIKVALRTGKIKVEDERQSAIIDMPNKGVYYSNSDEKLDTLQFDSKEAFAWKDGILYFKNASFEEMVARFEHWYGVSFHIANMEKADDKLFTGEFNNETLSNVLKGLSFSKDFNFEIKNNDVYIEFN